MLELLRQCRRRTAARMGVAFASLWLAFAAVPCSALEGVDLGHAHGATAAAEHACPHCPDAAPEALGATPGECSGLDDALLAKLGALDLVLAVAPALPPAPVAASRECAVAPAPRDPDRPPAVPLNLRYCTFLE